MQYGKTHGYIWKPSSLPTTPNPTYLIFSFLFPIFPPFTLYLSSCLLCLPSIRMNYAINTFYKYFTIASIGLGLIHPIIMHLNQSPRHQLCPNLWRKKNKPPPRSYKLAKNHVFKEIRRNLKRQKMLNKMKNRTTDDFSYS